MTCSIKSSLGNHSSQTLGTGHSEIQISRIYMLSISYTESHIFPIISQMPYSVLYAVYLDPDDILLYDYLFYSNESTRRHCFLKNLI